MSNQPTEESFLKDVAKHQMEILQDNGVYRHVRFANPGTYCYSFNLITGPGFLLYRGDMGCFEFERLHDMFEFFRPSEGDLARHKSKGRNIPINLGYWSEKLEAVDKDGGHKKFSAELFKANVFRCFKNFAQGRRMDREDRLNLIAQVRDDVFEYEAINAALCFDFLDKDGKHHNPFQDIFEYSNREYTYHFVWCCYAIVWGIQQYDALKAGKITPDYNTTLKAIADLGVFDNG